MQETPRTRFGYRFVTMARQWRRMIDHDLAQSGLSDASWAPLVNLALGGDDVSQAELAERVGLDASSLVRLLDLLEKRALIERRVDPADRRARRILLTDLGRSEVARIRDRLQGIESEMLADLDDATLAAMIEAFERIETRIHDADPKRKRT
ncbi:MarR family transcriptional regulator [Pseudooceanicola sp. CBS1P-1]|uniref:MarR family transcriptional regulator n=1 Tax=Pseudooceanicola albus TaxID=2692189 RepID=A0A6L7G6B1_9RHOB|nr:MULTISPECIES: MarR family transcriptional regulator [Pseudooceanicola]MBT9385978.1 MarR family transcriptional regulator [Pseudooceanicola endophyticus]MXN19601.1 MarR family transcriptional regulator [Pseudooceanicola albus]